MLVGSIRRILYDAHVHRLSNRYSNILACFFIDEARRTFEEDIARALVTRSFIAYAYTGGVQPPICCMRDKRLPTPQWSVIFLFRTRMTSTDSKWILRWVGAMPRKGPLCVP